MDDLLKQLTGQGGQAGVSGQGAGEAIGGLGGLLGGLLGGGGSTNALGGGLGAILPALLPSLLGMLGGKTAANQSGLHQLVDTMHTNGMGDVAQSWVGTGANQPITAEQVNKVLSPEQLAQLSAASGLPPEQVAQGVAAVLPDVVNTLTPDGTLPDPAQVQGTTDQLQSALAGSAGGTF
jgi:uncharacterized protein YidB (DUF937 family)